MSKPSSPKDLTKAKMSPSRSKQVDALTFGIEFEFALATRLTPTSADPSPKDTATIDIISSGLSQWSPGAYECVSRHIANSLIFNRISAYSHLAPKTQEELNLKATNPEQVFTRENAFCVSEDISIKAPDEKYSYYGIEIQSNPMAFSEISLDCIKKAAKVLTGTYRTFPDHETGNRSTGLHVHVGNGSKGFDVKTIRNLAALLWVFEEPLALIHPAHRRTSQFCLGPSHSELGRELDMASVGLAARTKGFERIMSAGNSNKIIDMMTVGGRGAYNFENLRKPFRPDDTKITIEFRIHEGTLNAERIAYWTRFCHGIVRFARDMKPDYIEDMLRVYLELLRLKGIEEYNVATVMSFLSMEDIGLYYQVRIDEAARKEKERNEDIAAGRLVPDWETEDKMYEIDPLAMRMLGGYQMAIDDPFGMGGEVDGEGWTEEEIKSMGVEDEDLEEDLAKLLEDVALDD